MKNNIFNSGFSIVELLISLSIISLLLFYGTLGFKASLRRSEFERGLRTITSSLNLARYRSIKLNRRVKISIKKNRLIIFDGFRSKWIKYYSEKLQKVTVKMNASPVFHPTGKASPMCSIFINNSQYLCRITLSITGRIRICKNRLQNN